MNPSWAGTAVWWSVYPLGACGAPIRQSDAPGVHHRLGRLEPWLDHLIELGCNGLALGPIWASSSHGYDVIDHLKIDSRLGDDCDFDNLVAACRSRGIRLLLDGVFNHVSVEHSDVRTWLDPDDVSPGADLLLKDAHDPAGLSRFEGHESLVELDHSKPEVAEYVVEVMNHWLERGADGWRLDAAYRVPSAFWAQVLPQVRSRYPEALILAEILHGDYAEIAAQAGFDSVTQYELWKAAWSSLRDRNPHELLWALERHDSLCPHLIAWTFVGNHDVTRIATQIGAVAARVATGIIMTVAGMPALYYGDEFGLTGLKQERFGGDDEIRPRLGPYRRQLEDFEQETLRLTQLAIRIRRCHPWLVRGRTEVSECTQDRISWLTHDQSGAWITAELDVADRPSLRICDQTGELLVL